MDYSPPLFPAASDGLAERGGIALVVLLFCAALAPYAADFLTHHPDERHYTDAGIEMVRRGDYLTPYTAAGQPRLKKPIIPYWMTAFSYRLLGVSPWSSRLPFLLAGGAVVWLTYLLARRMLDDRSWALLAAWIVACNPSLMISAPRSTPDVALALFLLLGVVGFVGLIVKPKTTWSDLAAAYGGGALAVLSKGLPGVALLGYALAFLVVWPSVRRRQSWGRHGLVLCGGLLLAGSWFALMYHLHGEALTSTLRDDQIERRLAGSVGQVVEQFFLIPLLLGACFLPWMAPLGVSGFGWRRFAHTVARRPEGAFLLGWAALWICLASLVERVNLRYLLPVAPLLSVLAALAWRQADALRLRRAARPGWWAAIVALGATAAFSAGVIAYTGEAAMAVMLLAAVGGGVAVLVRWSRETDAVALAGQAATACLLMLAVAALGLRPLVAPDLGARIALELHDLARTHERPLRAIFIGKPAVAARARVFLSEEISLRDVERLAPEALQNARVALVAGEDAEDLGGPWRATHTFAHGWKGFSVPEALQAAAQGELHAFLQSRRQTLTIAVRGEASESASPVVSTAKSSSAKETRSAR